MSPPPEFSVRFWGVRGSIACSCPSTSGYGGNTSCLEVRCGDRLLILDCGTGLRYLGRFMEAHGDTSADILLTHTHFDHICGVPFFTPLFTEGNRFRLWAGHLMPDLTIHDALKAMMVPPFFPVPPEIFKAELAFEDFQAGEARDLGGGIRVATIGLNHPDGATGYRIEFAGRVLCYVTDTEHVVGQPDQNVLRLIDGADLVIYDSMYTDEEFKNHIGWGHSTWQEGARLCKAAGVGRFVAFHHDPEHSDALLDRIASQAAEVSPGAVVAREGQVLTL